MSDVSSPVYIDPPLAACYHGDYDQQIQDAGFGYIGGPTTATFRAATRTRRVVRQGAFAPDYTLDVTPASVSICAPANAVYTVNVGSILGYTDPVTLGVSGNPAGTTTNFSANPVTPAGSSTLTVGNTGAASAGSSTLTGSATSTSGPKTANATLNLFTAAAGQPTLLTPANGATNVPVPPTFTWTAAAQAGTYSIQIATDAGFTNIVDQASGLTAPTYMPGVSLNTNTLYYWHVQATNTCGPERVLHGFNFRTVAAPGDCAVGTTPNILYQYGFEFGASGWTHSGMEPIAGQSSRRIRTPASHYRANDPATVSDQRLVSPAVIFRQGRTRWCSSSGTCRTSRPAARPLVGMAASWRFPPRRHNLDSGAECQSVGRRLPAHDQLRQPAGQSAGLVWRNYLPEHDCHVSAYAGQTAQFRMRLGSEPLSVLRGGTSTT